MRDELFNNGEPKSQRLFFHMRQIADTVGMILKTGQQISLDSGNAAYPLGIKMNGNALVQLILQIDNGVQLLAIENQDIAALQLVAALFHKIIDMAAQKNINFIVIVDMKVRVAGLPGPGMGGMNKAGKVLSSKMGIRHKVLLR